MSLYDAILLLRARWRVLTVVPGLALAFTAAFIALLPGEDEARMLLRVESPVPARWVAVLNSRTFADHVGAVGIRRLMAESRRTDGQLVEVRAWAANGPAAERVLHDALIMLRKRESDETQRFMGERRALLRRPHTRAMLIEFEVALMRRIDTRTTFDVLDPPRRTARPFNPYPFIAASVTSVLLSTGIVFVSTWWAAERAAHAESALKTAEE